MKDTNVLEAKNLCVNGNPVTNYNNEIVKRFNKYFIEALYDYHILKGTHVTRPIGEYPEPIILPSLNERIQGLNKMTESKRYPGPPSFRTIKGESPISGLKPKDFICSKGWKVGNEINPGEYELKKAKKSILKKSRFSKLKKWLKYWFTPKESDNEIVESYRNSREFNEAINKLSDDLKFQGHRNPPKAPISTGEIIKNKECEELESITPFTKNEFINAYNLFLPVVDHYKIKSILAGISYRCIRQNENLSDAVNKALSTMNEYGTESFSIRLNQGISKKDIFNDSHFDYYSIKAKAIEHDRIKRAQKLVKLRRRKKRYSISTPITRK